MATGDIVSVTIRADGWSADVVQSGDCTAGTYAFGLGTNNADLANAKFLLTVTSEGYNASGVLGTIQRLVYGTAIVRKPYPDHATLDQVYDGTTNTTSRIALSDFVYDDDQDGGAGTSGTDVAVAISGGWCTVGGTPQSVFSGTATNSSTVDYPKVIGHFAVEQRRPVNGTHAIEVVAFHKFGMNGKPVARVAITATGASSSNVESGAATAMSKSARADSLPVYAVNLDLSVSAGFTRGELVTTNFVAYPWVGDEASTLDSAADAGATIVDLGPLYWTVMDKMIAVVDATNGSADGVASTSQATADAAPCSSIQVALEKIAAKNNADYSLNVVDGGEVQLVAGTYEYYKGAQASTNGYWTLCPHSSTNRAGAVLAATAYKVPYKYCRLYNLTVTRASNVYVFNGLAAGTITIAERLAFNDVRTGWYSGGAGTDIEFLDCEYSNTYFSPGGNDGRCRLHRGCTYVPTTGTATPAGQPSCLLSFSNTGSTKSLWSGLNNTAYNNIVIAYSRAISITDGLFVGYSPNYARTNIALVCNLIERLGASSTAIGEISAGHHRNILLWHNTFAGQRFNHENDITTPANYSFIDYVGKFNSFNARGNHRADVQQENATLVGTWSIDYSVGWFGNHNEAISYGGDQDFWGLASNTDTGTGIDPAVPAGYVSDKSRGGTDAGGGDYKPDTGSVLLSRIPAGMAVLPYDLNGIVIPNDGTGDAGALQDDLVAAPTVTTAATPAQVIKQSASFSATATDEIDGDLTDEITWSSSVDGPLDAVGGTCPVDSGWSVDEHVVTASVTNSNTLTGTDNFTVEVQDFSAEVSADGTQVVCRWERPQLWVNGEIAADTALITVSGTVRQIDPVSIAFEDTNRTAVLTYELHNAPVIYSGKTVVIQLIEAGAAYDGGGAESARVPAGVVVTNNSNIAEPETPSSQLITTQDYNFMGRSFYNALGETVVEHTSRGATVTTPSRPGITVNDAIISNTDSSEIDTEIESITSTVNGEVIVGNSDSRIDNSVQLSPTVIVVPTIVTKTSEGATVVSETAAEIRTPRGVTIIAKRNA